MEHIKKCGCVGEHTGFNKMKGKPWVGGEQYDWLWKNKRYPLDEVACFLGRSTGAVRTKLKELALEVVLNSPDISYTFTSNGTSWSEEHELFVWANQYVNHKALCETIGRTPGAVRARISLIKKNGGIEGEVNPSLQEALEAHEDFGKEKAVYKEPLDERDFFPCCDGFKKHNNTLEMKGKRWTEEEDANLQLMNADGVHLCEIACKLHRTTYAVWCRLNLGDL